MKKIILSCMLLLSAATYCHAQNTIYSYIAALENENFCISQTAISCLDYDKYLNFADMKFITLLPTNNALQSFVDPVSYGTTTTQMWNFQYDETKAQAQRIYADVYDCTFDETQWVEGDKKYTVKNKSITDLSTTIHDRMEFILQNSIIPEQYRADKKYYKTMGSSYVRIEEGGKTVYGSDQQNTKQSITAQSVNETDNGLCIVLPSVPMTTSYNVAKQLSLHPEFSEFLNILQNCGALALQDSKDKWAAGATEENYGNLFNIKVWGEIGAENRPSSSSTSYKATYLLNNGDYTLYAPTNDAMQIAYNAGLPKPEDLAAAETYDLEHEAEYTDSATRVKEAWLNFVKYHIQNHSIFIDNGFESGSYKTDKYRFIEMTQSDEDGNVSATGNYRVGPAYKLNVNVSSSAMTVTDAMGNARKVVTKDGLYNIMANEYWISSSGYGTSGKIMQSTDAASSYYLDNSSFVVIHAIDGPLLYDAPAQFTYTYYPLANE